MPSVYPATNESESTFIDRFSTDLRMVNEFPDAQHRRSVAKNIYEKYKRGDVEILRSGELYDALSQNTTLDEDGESIISECFIIEDKDSKEVNISSTAEIVSEILKTSIAGFDKNNPLEKEFPSIVEAIKSISGSTQRDSELGQSDAYSLGSNHLEDGLAGVPVIEPPYPPLLMSIFLQIDEIHYRCVRTKVADSLLREYVLEPVQNEDGSEYDPGDVGDEGDGKKKVNKNKEKVDSQITEIRNFIEDANDKIGFEGVLERAGLDYESIGWAAIEVIRSRDMKIRKIDHIPASRIRVLKGWKGFVESYGSSKPIYYQNFTEKVVSASEDRVDIFTGKRETYNPRFDGELDADKLKWNLIDRETGKPTDDFLKSANEILFIPKHSNHTIYYGFTDIVPAVGSILANVHIRDYLLQFFEHNTIPRYAVVIENAKVAPEVKEAILSYFSTHIKGKAHKTLVLAVPSTRGEVRVRFEKLASDHQEGSFQETKKNNAQSIMAAHGVSPAIIGVSEHSELGSGKGLSQAEIYKDRIISPSQRRWELHVNRLFRFGLGVSMVKLSFNPLDIRDLAAEQTVFTGYAERGIMTYNEVRRRCMLGDPVEGGDRPFVIQSGQIYFLDEMKDQISTVIEDAQAEVESLNVQLQSERTKSQMKQQSQQPSGKTPKKASNGAAKKVVTKS